MARGTGRQRWRLELPPPRVGAAGACPRHFEENGAHFAWAECGVVFLLVFEAEREFHRISFM